VVRDFFIALTLFVGLLEGHSVFKNLSINAVKVKEDKQPAKNILISLLSHFAAVMTLSDHNLYPIDLAIISPCTVVHLRSF